MPVDYGIYSISEELCAYFLLGNFSSNIGHQWVNYDYFRFISVAYTWKQSYKAFSRMCVVGDNSKILSQVCFFSFWKSQYTSDRLSSSKSHLSYLNVYLKVPNYPAIADKMAYQYLRQLAFAACRFLLRRLSLKGGLHSCRPYLRKTVFCKKFVKFGYPFPIELFIFSRVDFYYGVNRLSSRIDKSRTRQI